MWFGDLVTMKWWNDLWLNESFATYMSYIALTEIKDLHQYSNYAWLDFLDTKFEGVSNDQLLSTHPICSDIKSTDQVESIFDGISYGKGASFLK
jgi:aminopeptidase N